MRQSTASPVKKPYRPPKLIVYGDLPTMTRAKFKGIGKMDGTGSRKT
jgi:hypothetical protein